MGPVSGRSDGRPASAPALFWAGFLFFPVVFLVFFALGQERAEARVDGSLQYNYTNFQSKTSSKQGGAGSSISGQVLDQIFRFDISQRIYPRLSFDASGTFDRDSQESEGRSSASTTFNPAVGLDFGTYPFTFGLAYSRTVQAGSIGGAPFLGFGLGQSPQSDTYDRYTANFGWAPWGLPSLTVLYNKSHYFDNQDTLDVTQNGVSASTSYTPVHSLMFGDSADWSKTADKLRGTTVTTVDDNFDVMYRRAFWHNRVGASWDYNFGFSRSAISAQSGSTLVYRSVSPSPFDAFYVETPSPAVQADAVSFNQCQSYGGYECGEAPGLVSGLGSAPVNIGSNGNPDNLQAWQWEVGLEFSSGAVISANVLFIYVNQDISELLKTLPNAFSWTVYTSADNVNWSQLPVDQVSYSAINPVTLSNRPGFELDLSPDQQLLRWVKIVVNVASSTDFNILPPAERLQFANIFVTQAQVFDRQQASQVSKISTTSLSQAAEMSLSAHLLDNPAVVYYHLSAGLGWDDNVGFSATTYYQLSHQLTISRQFSRHLSDTTSISMDDSGAGRTRYSLSSSLAVNAGPLQTSLLYSYSFPKGGYLSTNFNPVAVATGYAYGYLNGYMGKYLVSGLGGTLNSIGLYNSYRLYPGLMAHMQAGFSFPSFSFMQQQGTGFFYSIGADMVPYRTYHIDFNYAESHSGGATVRQGNGEFSWAPFANLYLTCSDYFTEAPGVSVNAFNYRVNWAPSNLSNGDVQLTFFFQQQGAQGLSAGSHTAMGPGLTWRLAPSAVVEASYFIVRAEDGSAATNTNSLSVSVTKTF